ncbi:MAG: single-stranded DNA-binding protein [Planctomycetota bacterium]
MYNKVILIGNLTADPRELRTTQSGMTVGDFRIAVNDRSAGRDNERTLFIDVTVWGKTAENCHRYLVKGKTVLVEGRLEEDSWTDKESGQPRSKMRVNANQVTFMPDRKGGSSEGGSYGDGDDDRGGERSSYSGGGSRGSSSGSGGSGSGSGSGGSGGSGYAGGGGGGSRGSRNQDAGGGSPLKDYGLDDEVPF